MSTARDHGRPAVFVQELHRAAAQRGKLDPVYQDLSDHWTAILQRLYPVWALIGPGLSDPGHIEIHSRTIYLDSDTLLGTREQIVAGRLERRAVLRCFGVALHETFHGKHTKRWAIDRDVALSESEDPVERQLAIDRRLLEEPRMEAHGVREHPDGTVRGRFVRHALEAALSDVILPAFAKHLPAEPIAGTALTRDMAGRATVYLQARTHYGIVHPAVLNGLRDRWRQVLGDRDMHRLEELFARLVWIPDGELDALDHAAHEYARSSDRPTQRHPKLPSGPAAATPDPAGASAGPLGQAPSAKRSSRRCEAHARDSSSSSTPTSTCSRYSPTQRPTPGEARPVRGAGRACRPGGCPIAASTDRRPGTRSNTPAGTPTGSDRRSRTAPGRSTSEPQAADSTAAPTPAANPNATPDGPPPPTHGGSPARSPPRSRSPTWGW
ncbi:MAG TPA: hypothetical protein VGF91_09005 [Solirubrobacteraceae bacterium]